MAMTEASATAEVASATAVKLFTAEMIREHADRAVAQPWSRSNEALKHFRDLLEIGFVPQVFQQNLELEPLLPWIPLPQRRFHTNSMYNQLLRWQLKQ